ncbi:MAG: hypothetical protein MZW92_66915 [Comamonadaceae bacterium]|nr:hypothetical protein [Comamonadaceae bacterium]
MAACSTTATARRSASARRASGLLTTSADLWRAEDRRVVGAHAAAAGSRTSAGAARPWRMPPARCWTSWPRRWTTGAGTASASSGWQDGQWRRLSGPGVQRRTRAGADGAAVRRRIASYYRQSSSALAPRLVMLDEAFAGIDDAARAHCMGLVHEFDLDFVITSEREWACYADAARRLDLPTAAPRGHRRRASSRAGPGTAWRAGASPTPARRFPAAEAR